MKKLIRGLSKLPRKGVSCVALSLVATIAAVCGKGVKEPEPITTIEEPTPIETIIADEDVDENESCEIETNQSMHREHMHEVDYIFETIK